MLFAGAGKATQKMNRPGVKTFVVTLYKIANLS